MTIGTGRYIKSNYKARCLVYIHFRDNIDYFRKEGKRAS